MRTLISLGYRSFSLPAKEGLALLELLAKARVEDHRYVAKRGYLYVATGEALDFSAEVHKDEKFVTSEEFEAAKEAEDQE